MSGKNRQKQQDAKRAKREAQQAHMVAADQRKHLSHFNLDWFIPSEIQEEICFSYYTNDLTAVQGSSGTGKSTTAVWLALNDIKDRNYQKLIFCKTPAELGDDKIGFLTGSADEKLAMHFEDMRGIFHSFMTIEKLRMEEANGHIEFTIPNFIAGRTIDNAIIILDESQLLSPGTVKLLLERAGQNCKVLILGDRYQRYACNTRDDGFTDFVSRMTHTDEYGERHSIHPMMGYVEMGSGDNERSDLSREIVRLYEE